MIDGEHLTGEDFDAEVRLRLVLGLKKDDPNITDAAPVLPEGAEPLPLPNHYGTGPTHPFFSKQ